jgi:hypothetical protein
MDEIIHTAFIMLIAIVFLMAMPAMGQNDRHYILTWSAINGGGGQSSGGQYELTGTIGKPDSGYSQSGNNELSGGFWPVGQLCLVDFSDFTRFANYWLESGSYFPADLNFDMKTDFYDLQMFAEVWLCNCPNGWSLK